MKRISHFLLLSIFLASCANAATPTPNVTLTSQATVTFTPAPTSTATEVLPTATAVDPNRPPDATGKDKDGYYKDIDGKRYRQLELANGESLWAFSSIGDPDGLISLWHTNTYDAISFRAYVDSKIPGAEGLSSFISNPNATGKDSFTGKFRGAIKQNLPSELSNKMSPGVFDQNLVIDAIQNHKYIVSFNASGDQDSSGLFKWDLQKPATVIFRQFDLNNMPEGVEKHNIVGKSNLVYLVRSSSDINNQLIHEVFISSFDDFSNDDIIQMILYGILDPFGADSEVQTLSVNVSDVIQVH